MTAKEAREIIDGMELSAETLLEAEAMLSAYSENDEIPEDLIDKILLVVDKEVDVKKIVEDEAEINSLL